MHIDLDRQMQSWTCDGGTGKGGFNGGARDAETNVLPEVVEPRRMRMRWRQGLWRYDNLISKGSLTSFIIIISLHEVSIVFEDPDKCVLHHTWAWSCPMFTP